MLLQVPPSGFIMQTHTHTVNPTSAPAHAPTHAGVTSDTSDTSDTSRALTATSYLLLTLGAETPYALHPGELYPRNTPNAPAYAVREFGSICINGAGAFAQGGCLTLWDGADTAGLALQTGGPTPDGYTPWSQAITVLITSLGSRLAKWRQQS